MCGIAGILHFGTMENVRQKAGAMADSIRHRGPDGEGFHHSRDVSLAHRRLSILDIDGGAQPMFNEDGGVVVVYNGEIYNHRKLRRELEGAGHVFASSHSDTEILVHGWEEWGTELPAKLNGMFAFAVWDERERSLFLARDRFGIKPLYMADSGGIYSFASELRALFASGLVERRPDCAALLEYLCCQSNWGLDTMFEGIKVFPAGSWELRTPQSAVRRRYWDLEFTRDSNLGMEDAAAQHREILERVVRRQVEADVPVMTYLSGGIDSSSVTAMAYRLDPAMRSYSCIFDLTDVGADRNVDEREFSRAVASSMGIEHVELELPADSLERHLDRIMTALEYPMMGLIYVNYLIAERVALDGKVVLSGMGGDELHAGYVNRYHGFNGTHPNLLSRLKSLFSFGAKKLGQGYARFNVPLPVAEMEQALSPDVLRMADGYDPFQAIPEHLNAAPGDAPSDRIMYMDATVYLHGLLAVEDKLSMAHGLETRVPLLDNELVDFVRTLDFNLLNDGETGKRVFRESVKPMVPREIYAKPKIGFAPPETSWYRGKLRPFLERRLSPEAVARTGVFRPEYAAMVLDQHFSGKQNRQGVIWAMLNVQSWCAVHGLFGES